MALGGLYRSDIGGPMDRKTAAYAMVTAHVMDEAMPAVQELLDRYGVPMEEFAEVLAPILAHQFSHAYDTGAGNGGGPSDEEIERNIPAIEASFAERRQAEPNPLEELLAALAAGEDAGLDLDAECKAAGLC